MASDRLQLQLLIAASGAQRTAAEIRAIQEAIERNTAASRANSQQSVQGNSAVGVGLAEVAFRFNNVVGALQNLRAAAAPVYDALIASNEKLNAQILSSQTNLASSVRIFKGDTEIVDPTEKIQASAGKLRAAIKQIEFDTQSLVGVTSAQVNELFQITLTNAAALNNQSKQFPDAIAAATSLTKGWAASLKVVGIPLEQARQEINSIIKGQVTQDSILAKNLNITNQQVESWRSQGKLVDELNKRLDVFVAGNAIAARSIEGISSNILDLGERISRTIGEPFLEPLINALAEVEKYLKGSEGAISAFFGQLSSEIISAGSSIGEAFAPVGKTLLEIGADFGSIALSAVKGLLQVFVGLAKVVAPLADLLGKAVKVLADFAATDLGGIVVQTGAVVLVMGQLVTIIAGLAAAALPALGAAVLATVTSMGTLYASFTAVAAGNTALALSIPAVQTAMALLTAESIALTAALVPLTAAIGLAVLVRTTNDLKDGNEALEAYGQQILSTIDAVGSISVELNQLNKITAAGGALSEEQIKRQKQLNAAAQAQVEGIQAQIKAEKELTNLSKDQAAQRDGNIKTLEAMSQKLDKATGGIKLQSKELEVLGTSSEQFAKQLENANRNIKSEGQGDAAQFKEAAKQVISLAKSGVEAKLLTVAAAREQLEAIKNNTKVDLETQTAAKEAIDKLYDGRIAKVKELIEVGTLQADGGIDELAKIRDDATLEASTRRRAGQQIISIRKEQIAAESAAIAAGQVQIAAQQSQQRIGEARADEESTRLKVAEINKRIEAGKVAFENATNDTERAKLKADAFKDVAEFDKLEADLNTRRRKRAIEDFDERRNLIKAQNDLGVIDRDTYNRQILTNDLAQSDVALEQQQKALELLAVGDKEGREAINSQISQLQSKRVEIVKAFDRADSKRQQEFYDQELTLLEAARKAGIVSQAEFDRAQIQNRVEQADAEIAVARRELNRLGVADTEGRNAILSQIAQLESKQVDARKAFDRADLKRQQEFYDQELALLELAQKDGVISASVFNRTRMENRTEQIEAEIAVLDRELSRLGKADVEGRNAIDGQIAQLRGKRIEVMRAFDDEDLKRQRDFYEQELTIQELAKNKGAISQSEFTRIRTQNQLQQADAEIAVLERKLSRLGKADIDGRNAINARIAQLQSKQIADVKSFDDEDLKRQQDFYERELTAWELAKDRLSISESEYAQIRAQKQVQQADAEITVLQRELGRLGKADVEGKGAVNKKIDEANIRKIKALEESYRTELVLVQDAQSKILALVSQSEILRSIELQKLINSRTIRQEDADKLRSRSLVSKQRAELKQAQDFEAALARVSQSIRTPEVEREYQSQVREARAKTLAVTLQLSQAEGAELERLRGLALKGIEDVTAARTRGVDLELSQIARVGGERARATKDAEANASREIFALDLVTKTLDRQNSLLVARNNLTKARFDAATSEGDLELTRVNRAIELKRQLDSNLPTEQRIVLMKELADLTQNSNATEYQLVQQKLAIEQRNGELKRENILFQQAADRAALSVEQQKIDLANQRAVIEARIAELKAKQSVLDAKSVVDQTELNNRKSIDAANLALEQANALQPGRERDKAIEDAKGKLAIATTEAETNTANALQGVDLAQQQAEFAGKTTEQAVEQMKSFSSIKDLQSETLRVQQNMVLEQLKAAEAAKRYADELERAKAALTQTSTTYSTPLVFQARARGGAVNSGQAYIVGENSPELFVPGVSGTVLNREQILKNLGSLGGLNLNMGGGKGVDNERVVAAVQSLEQTILSRPPVPIVANFAATDDGQLDKMFAIQRSALRGI